MLTFDRFAKEFDIWCMCVWHLTWWLIIYVILLYNFTGGQLSEPALALILSNSIKRTSADTRLSLFYGFYVSISPLLFSSPCYTYHFSILYNKNGKIHCDHCWWWWRWSLSLSLSATRMANNIDVNHSQISHRNQSMIDGFWFRKLIGSKTNWLMRFSHPISI